MNPSTANKHSMHVYLVIFIGMTSLVLGAMVMIGWLIQSPTLIQIAPQFAPMQFNTALGFLLSGLGLILLKMPMGKHPLIFLVGMGIASLGILTILQYLFGINLRIDNLFVEPYITTKTSHPGRMAPNTAICFTLVGLSFMLSYWLYASMHKIRGMHILGVVVLVLGCTALIGYLFNLESTYGWGSLTRMALHTSIGFILIGFSIIIESGFIQRASSTTNAHWISSSVACVFITLTISVYTHVLQQENRIIENKIHSKYELIQENLSTMVDAQFLALKRMAQRWETRDLTTYPEWQNDAYNYVIDQTGLISVGWYDLELKPVWEESDVNQVKAMSPQGLAMDSIGNHEAPFKHFVTPTHKVTDDSFGFRILLPVEKQGILQGYMVGVFEYKSLIAAVIRQEVESLFDLKVLDHQGRELFQADSGEHLSEMFQQSDVLNIVSQKTTLILTPSERFISMNRSIFPDAIFILGLIFSVILGLLIHFAIRINAYAKKYNSKKEELESILDNTHEAIIGLDGNSNIIFSNHAFKRQLARAGLPVEEVSLDEILPYLLSSETSQMVMSHIHQAVATGQIIFEKTLHYKDNQEQSHAIEYTIQPMKREADGVMGAVCVIRDITTKIQAQEQLTKTLNELKISNHDLEQFAYVASHDLKSPLRGIDNLVEWIEEDVGDQLDEKHKRYLALVQDRIARMSRLLDDLLAFATVGKQNVDESLINLAELVDDVISIRHTSEHMSIEYDEQLNHLTVNCMPLKQVLVNLIDNAVKYNDKKQGHIIVSAKEEGEYIAISVKDNGPGIAPEYHEKIFNMFQKLKPKDEVEGSGIGLAIVKKTVQWAGGEIYVRSQEGQGAEFIVYWPKVMSDRTTKEGTSGI